MITFIRSDNSREMHIERSEIAGVMSNDFDGSRILVQGTWYEVQHPAKTILTWLKNYDEDHA